MAFGAALSADGARLATRTFALTRLARGAGDSRTFSVGIGIHGAVCRASRGNSRDFSAILRTAGRGGR